MGAKRDGVLAPVLADGAAGVALGKLKVGLVVSAGLAPKRL